MTEKEMLELKIATHNEDLKKIKHIFNQDKIWFAVEQLEKVKEMLQPYLRFDINLYLQTIQDIDNQIKAIKEMK